MYTDKYSPISGVHNDKEEGLVCELPTQKINFSLNSHVTKLKTMALTGHMLRWLSGVSNFCFGQWRRNWWLLIMLASFLSISLL